MRRFTSVLTTVMLPLALASCEGRKDAPPEAFGPHEVASPATKQAYGSTKSVPFSFRLAVCALGKCPLVRPRPAR